MTWHDASHTGVSIFINKENLVFALPLISICTIYAYFKYVPLNLGLSIIGAGIVIYKVTSSLKTRAIEKKEEKIANLDESLLKELAADEINREKEEKQRAAKKKLKAENRARQRIAAEKKKYSNGSKKQEEEEEENDDGEDISTFAQGNRRNKKRN
mmetsp:Transcript_19453/g.24498  ORF Transcript_19453/g.24498 Transcript_19453/m.24498 type:complete len:156 (+) Transcript_19453:101-568(+)